MLNTPTRSTSATALASAAVAAIAYLAGIDFDLTSIDWSIAINWLVALTGVGGITGYITSDRENARNGTEAIDNDNRPLGIRNNNPGNIRPLHKGSWLGETGSNSGFSTFSEPLYGLRAMARNLKNQKRLHGIDTLNELIYKYAPPIENDTESYIAFVSAKTAIDPVAKVDFEDSVVLIPVMRAMIKMENGQNPYSDELIKTAISIA